MTRGAGTLRCVCSPDDRFAASMIAVPLAETRRRSGPSFPGAIGHGSAQTVQSSTRLIGVAGVVIEGFLRDDLFDCRSSGGR